jgi:chorismate mutase/prephenate dehydratase
MASGSLAARAAKRRARAEADDDALAVLRRRIDIIDDRILDLLARRAELALRVGQVKKTTGRRVFDPKRERTVLRRVVAANRGPLSATAIGRIFREIVRQHRRLAQLARLPDANT